VFSLLGENDGGPGLGSFQPKVERLDGTRFEGPLSTDSEISPTDAAGSPTVE
jgi:hypothetical protein